MIAYPVETEVPLNSRIAGQLEGADFYDSWSITSSEAGKSALDHFIAAAKRTPRWIDMCMTARNRMGRLVGLKDLGTLSGIDVDRQASDYMPGDRIGIFTIFEIGFNEALIGDNDRHLDVMLSIHRKEILEGKQVMVTVTTVVRVKNILGRVYMLPVEPMHRLIAPAVLAAIGNSPHAE